MGSFLAQHFITEHGDAVRGVVLSGTSGAPSRGAVAARAVARVERFRLGPRGKSALVDAMTLGPFNKGFAPARTPFDWLSRDTAEVDRYAADPLCGAFRASAQMSIDILDGIREIARPRRQARIPKPLPVFILAGMRDPVGGDGRGVDRLLAKYADAGLARVSYCFYPGARHELFNETNRDQVTHDLIRWLNALIG
jgi:alpha-beta hydrolase superfamily lysophospholipase